MRSLQNQTKYIPISSSGFRIKFPHKIMGIYYTTIRPVNGVTDGCFLEKKAKVFEFLSNLASYCFSRRKHSGSTHHHLLTQSQKFTPKRQLFEEAPMGASWVLPAVPSLTGGTVSIQLTSAPQLGSH